MNVKAVVAVTALMVALPVAAPASAAEPAKAPAQPVLTDCSSLEGCAFDALSGVLGGFEGSVGSSLWGWVLGGSASAGTGEIAGDLASIETTLNTIEAELGPGGPIVTQLKKLQCATDSDWITAGPATAIDSWYATYSNFLTLLSDGSPVPVGEISSTNTDIDTLYGWANGVIQGDPGVAPTNVLTSMIELNNLSTQSSSAGTIADCIQAAGNQPATGSVDDRVYYSENVQPIQDYLLGLNTQAMIVLTEAYHIYAYGDCLTANGGDDAACSSSASTDVAPNLCPAGASPSPACLQPQVIYGQAGGQVTSGQLMPFLYAQFAAGGAPLSTDDYLLVVGTDNLVMRSIETYNAAANVDCPVPATMPCGPTNIDPHTQSLPQYPVGPYGYGSPGGGAWAPASASVFEAMMDGKFNTTNDNPNIEAGAFLCTLDTTGAGDPDTCTQSNNGMGLQYVSGKGIYFPERLALSAGNESSRGTAQCFLDGNLNARVTGQPLCTNARFQTLLNRSDPNNGFCALENSSVQNASMGSFAGYYQGTWCSTDEYDYADGWAAPAGYIVAPVGNAYPASFTWPALDITTLRCPNGKSPADPSNANPAGMLSLCGSDFNTWFAGIVPSPAADDSPSTPPSSTPGPSTPAPSTPAPSSPATSTALPTPATVIVNGLTNPPNGTDPGTPPGAKGDGFVVVSAAIANKATPNIYKKRATVKIGKAPKAKGSKYVVRTPIRLIARVAANTAYVIKVKKNKGSYRDLGTSHSDDSGKMSLPVFTASRTGTYTFAMINPESGGTLYVKVKVAKRS